MRIATLQFAPKVGDINGNVKRADELLRNWKLDSNSLLETVAGAAGGGGGIEELKLDILVLPELALTGYNFPSLEAIKPYLEPAGEGISGKWARETAKRLGCKVCVGYPEVERGGITQVSAGDNAGSSQLQEGEKEADDERYYNSLLVVDENGDVILNYRKSFLYYTDETWAREGNAERGFHELTFQDKDSFAMPPKKVATSFGICMDINPYRFEAPFTAWEFANRVLDSKSQLVVVSMAWLTLLSREELDILADRPEIDTFNYWIQRFLPLVRKQMGHEVDIDGEEGEGRKIVIVFANRAGEEDGPEGATPARYAGTSAIIAVTQQPRRLIPPGNNSETNREKGRRESSSSLSSDDEGMQDTLPYDVKILCWGMMGTTSEGICFADTTAPPKIVFGLVKPSDS